MNLIERAKNIIIDPNKEWDVIAGEEANVPGILTGYVLPLAGAAAVASFIGYALIGRGGERGISWALYYAVMVLGSAIISVFVSAFVIDALAPNFGSEKNMGKSIQLVAYASTPSWVGGLLAIVPLLGMIGGLFGLYGLYLLYLGLPKMKKTAADKQGSYLIVSLLVMLAVYLVIGLILAAILMPVFGVSSGNSTIIIRG